ncbi:hypothetical protein [Kalamiella sp. sgz302252]|uniref:hypothetical protein n=1 Tax=Pantoea sp. sgz302252 TaxID=3341827 RepID=UPI0036D250E1
MNKTEKAKQLNSAETSFIETWIKEDLRREIYYRLSFWTLSALITYYAISHSTGFSAIDYFMGYTKNTTKLLQFIAFSNIFIFMIAISFKDMEVKYKGAWSQEKPLGKFGSLIRKINGDWLLWVSSLALTFFIIILMTIYNTIQGSDPMNLGQGLIILACTVSLLIVSLIHAWLYVLVKKEGPSPFSANIENPSLIIPIYTWIMLWAVGFIFFII